jgi:hypothetical protein
MTAAKSSFLSFAALPLWSLQSLNIVTVILGKNIKLTSTKRPPFRFESATFSVVFVDQVRVLGDLASPLLDQSGRELKSHTTVPTNFPIPAVSAIANAPQNVTRTVARRILAPPAFAPIAPERARKPKCPTQNDFL